MKHVVACIDGSPIATAVCDAAAWASQRLSVPLQLLHVLDKSEYPAQGDYSGNIGLGSREYLLQKLAAVDQQRSKLAMEHGKHMLEDAEHRAQAHGALEITKLQRHGNLLDTLLELETDTRLLIMGRLGEGHVSTAHAIGSHLENVIRAMHRPILVTVQAFTSPNQFMIAYDGSKTAHKALTMVAVSPLLQGLPAHLVMVAGDTDEHRHTLEQGEEALTTAGFQVTTKILTGEVQRALHDYQQHNGIDLMVMGAYGHSRIRQFLVGSNTSRMVAMSDCSLLLLR